MEQEIALALLQLEISDEGRLRQAVDVVLRDLGEQHVCVRRERVEEALEKMRGRQRTITELSRGAARWMRYQVATNSPLNTPFRQCYERCGLGVISVSWQSGRVLVVRPRSVTVYSELLCPLFPPVQLPVTLGNGGLRGTQRYSMWVEGGWLWVYTQVGWLFKFALETGEMKWRKRLLGIAELGKMKLQETAADGVVLKGRTTAAGEESEENDSIIAVSATEVFVGGTLLLSVAGAKAQINDAAWVSENVVACLATHSGYPMLLLLQPRQKQELTLTVQQLDHQIRGKTEPIFAANCRLNFVDNLFPEGCKLRRDVAEDTAGVQLIYEEHCDQLHVFLTNSSGFLSLSMAGIEATLARTQHGTPLKAGQFGARETCLQDARFEGRFELTQPIVTVVRATFSSQFRAVCVQIQRKGPASGEMIKAQLVEIFDARGGLLRCVYLQENEAVVQMQLCGQEILIQTTQRTLAIDFFTVRFSQTPRCTTAVITPYYLIACTAGVASASQTELQALSQRLDGQESQGSQAPAQLVESLSVFSRTGRCEKFRVPTLDYLYALRAPYDRPEGLLHSISSAHLESIQRFNKSKQCLSLKIMQETAQGLRVKASSGQELLEFLFFMSGARQDNWNAFPAELALSRDFDLAYLLGSGKKTPEKVACLEVQSDGTEWAVPPSAKLNIKCRGQCYADCETYTEYARTVVFNAGENDTYQVEPAALLAQDVLSYAVYGVCKQSEVPPFTRRIYPFVEKPPKPRKNAAFAGLFREGITCGADMAQSESESAIDISTYVDSQAAGVPVQQAEPEAGIVPIPLDHEALASNRLYCGAAALDSPEAVNRLNPCAHFLEQNQSVFFSRAAHQAAGRFFASQLVELTQTQRELLMPKLYRIRTGPASVEGFYFVDLQPFRAIRVVLHQSGVSQEMYVVPMLSSLQLARNRTVVHRMGGLEEYDNVTRCFKLLRAISEPRRESGGLGHDTQLVVQKRTRPMQEMGVMTQEMAAALFSQVDFWLGQTGVRQKPAAGFSSFDRILEKLATAESSTEPLTESSYSVAPNNGDYSYTGGSASEDEYDSSESSRNVADARRKGFKSVLFNSFFKKELLKFAESFADQQPMPMFSFAKEMKQAERNRKDQLPVEQPGCKEDDDNAGRESVRGSVARCFGFFSGRILSAVKGFDPGVLLVKDLVRQARVHDANERLLFEMQMQRLASDQCLLSGIQLTDFLLQKERRLDAKAYQHRGDAIVIQQPSAELHQLQLLLLGVQSAEDLTEIQAEQLLFLPLTTSSSDPCLLSEVELAGSAPQKIPERAFIEASRAPSGLQLQAFGLPFLYGQMAIQRLSKALRKVSVPAAKLFFSPQFSALAMLMRIFRGMLRTPMDIINYLEQLAADVSWDQDAFSAVRSAQWAFATDVAQIQKIKVPYRQYQQDVQEERKTKQQKTARRAEERAAPEESEEYELGEENYEDNSEGDDTDGLESSGGEGSYGYESGSAGSREASYDEYDSSS